MSTFYDSISEDERNDWRKHHVTALAIEMLREHAGNYERAALAAVNDGNDVQARINTGEAKGIRFAIDLLESD